METTFILFLLVIALILLSQIGARKGVISPFAARKILHIGAVSLSAISIYLIDDLALLKWILAVSVPAVFLLVYFDAFATDDDRKSWGIFYYAAAFAILVFAFGDKPALVFYPLLVLALADGLAALIGKYFGGAGFGFSQEAKTPAGTFTFFLVSILSLFLPPIFFAIPAAFATIHAIIFLALFITVVELLSHRGQDNLWVPAAIIYWMLLSPNTGLWELGILIAVSAMAFGLARMKWLSHSGALAAWVLGCLLVFSPAPKWMVVPIAFLVLGSLLSKLPESVKAESFARTARQVFSNGLSPMLCFGVYFITDAPVFLLAAMSGIAAAMSDTASSEIGRRRSEFAYRIGSFKKIQSGQSGGVSLSGTLAGIFFSFLIAILGGLISPIIGVYDILLIGSVGVAGNFVDSVVGDRFQLKARSNGAEPWMDYNETSAARFFKGVSWIDNDRVNLISTTASCILAMMVAMLI